MIWPKLFVSYIFYNCCCCSLVHMIRGSLLCFLRVFSGICGGGMGRLGARLLQFRIIIMD